MRLLRREATFGDLGLDVTHLIGKQARELARLDQMVGYATTDTCRRAYVLEYFGETAPTACGSCDRCLEGRTGSVPLAPSPPRAAQPAVRVRIVAERPNTEREAPPAPLLEGGLAQALRAWRVAVAKERGLPAYCIVHDRVLEAIARVRPRTRDELLAIKGIGEEKFRQWGETLLAVIADDCEPAGARA